jgi:sec-independent protein translocase protein TatA
METDMLAIASSNIFPLALWNVGAPELIVIALVILLLFGGRKLPELARGLAKGLRGFKEEMRGIEAEADDVKKAMTEDPAASKDSEQTAATTDAEDDAAADKASS